MSWSALLAVGGDAVEVVGLGKAGGGVGIANGEARQRIGGEVVAEISDRGGGVVLVAWQRVRGVEVAKGSVVVELRFQAPERAASLR